MPEYGLKEPSYLGASARSLGGLLALVAAIAAAAGLGYLWYRSEAPAVELVGGFPRAIGQATPVRLRWTGAHGVRRISAVIRQQGEIATAYLRENPPARLSFLQAVHPPGEVEFTIGKEQMPSLRPGKANLAIEVQANDLRGIVAHFERDLPVALERPRVTPDPQPVFLRRGGTGVVAFTVAGDWSESGVRVGRYTFPSWPAAAIQGRRVCLFGYPPDLPAGAEPVVYARNAAGEEATAAFRHHVTGTGFRERTLSLSDSFIGKVISEIDPAGAGEPPDRYARINADTRRANDAALAALNEQSQPRRLWEGAFLMLPKAKSEARFGDHRTYIYKGRRLNVEWHLGVDLASTANAALPAANHGTVVLAGPLGIYGNCVAVDHGLGVISVYGHLSRIDVPKGKRVARGDILGLTGMTGMAGGDHVHVALLLNGVFVDPVEWSFAKWMDKSVMPLVKTLD